MECPECGSGKTRVFDSRSYAGAVYRKRFCFTCNYTFWTEETELPEENKGIVRELYSALKMKDRDSKKGK